MPADISESTITFNKTELLKLPLPTSGRVEYKDSKTPSLRVRVSSSGIKTFCVYRWLKIANKPERVTIGRFPEVSVEAARAKATDIIASFALGENPNEAKRKARSEMSFGQLFDLYIERHAKPHKRTWDEDVVKFKKYLSSDNCGVNLASKKLSWIERGHIAHLHAKIGTTHPITANRVIALVSSVFGRAIEWGIYENLNPAVGIRKFKETPRDRFLQRSELPRFFAALAVEPNEVIRWFFFISLLTGARRGNVQAMRWDCLDLNSGFWMIPGSESKNGVPLKIVLVPLAVEILREWRTVNKSEWVFPGKNTDGHLISPTKAWNRLLDNDELSQLKLRLKAIGFKFKNPIDETLSSVLARARTLCDELEVDTDGARMDNIRPHDLRHTLGSYQAIMGASLPIIGKSLGHKSQAATQMYAHLDFDPVRESVERATQAILDIGGVQVKTKEGT